jgi:ferredoxin-fold anticodon binding domain-containing protein
MPISFLFLHTMGKRQNRINCTAGLTDWTPYITQEVNVICCSGVVYHGVLKAVESDFILLKDFSGTTVKLSIVDLKELIIDYVSQ